MVKLKRLQKKLWFFFLVRQSEQRSVARIFCPILMCQTALYYPMSLFIFEHVLKRGTFGTKTKKNLHKISDLIKKCYKHRQNLIKLAYLSYIYKNSSRNKFQVNWVVLINSTTGFCNFKSLISANWIPDCYFQRIADLHNFWLEYL